RGYGFIFPSIAVDRSPGPHRGRVYVAWNEGLDWYDDLGALEGPAPGVSRVGSSSDVPFGIGDLLHGSIESGPRTHGYTFEGRAGETVMFHLDSLDATLHYTVSVYCADGVTRLAYNDPVWLGRPRVMVVTLPESATYRLSITGAGNGGGGYRVRTG